MIGSTRFLCAERKLYDPACGVVTIETGAVVQVIRRHSNGHDWIVSARGNGLRPYRFAVQPRDLSGLHHSDY